MDGLCFVKIGGSIITDTKNEAVAKESEIERLLKEINFAKQKHGLKIVLGHGGGSFGHIPAKRYNIQQGLVDNQTKNGASMIHQAMLDLNRIVVKKAIELEMMPYHFPPSGFAYAKNGKLVKGQTDQIKMALENGFMPIVHGDTVMDKAKGLSIASTEEVFRFLAKKLTPKRIILGTDTDGVYDKDPASNKDAILIDRIDSSNIQSVIKSTGGARKVDVTGGMKTKISILYGIVKNTNCIGYIANAGSEGVMQDLLIGNQTRCTLVKA